ncbi:MAG TPA: glycosyltransferase, partial [Terriglobales bacterium]|nr:glycosyltransferase [Terriglobales bacterium]
ALHARGHRIVFFEHNLEWYESNRDLPNPEFCQVHIFEKWRDVLPLARREMRDCDVAIVGSYFPDGAAAIQEVLDQPAAVKAFYDIDTPITVAQLRERGDTEYIRLDQIPGFDLYFSFTGGPMLREIEADLGARRAVPLYCSFDPDQYHSFPVQKRFACDLSYMGTYAPDRQPKIDEFLCRSAACLPNRKFIVAGPQYPDSVIWPSNVRRIIHLNPRWHARFYSSSRLTLNVTRRDMVLAGYSPSVRLFEAAASGATIVSDNWPGLNSFFEPGREILLPVSSDDVCRYITDIDDAELKRIGRRAQQRVLAEHTSERRAEEFEQAVRDVSSAIAMPPATVSQ